jgi:hypothetical protein
MSDELPPLSSKLSELLRKERDAAPAIPSGSAERVVGMLRALGPVVPPASGGGEHAPQAAAHKPPATWPVSKSLIVAGATGVLGFVGGLVATKAVEVPAPRAPEVIAPTQPAPAPAMTEPDAGHAQPAPAPEAPEPPKTNKRKPVVAPVEAPKAEPPPAPVVEQPAASTQTFDVQHASERQLIDAARVALGKGRSHDALVFLMGHERRFPEGTFVQERELLIIEAMVAEGRGTQAQQRGQAFLARFPHSTHAPRVRSLIDAQ